MKSIQEEHIENLKSEKERLFGIINEQKNNTPIRVLNEYYKVCKELHTLEPCPTPQINSRPNPYTGNPDLIKDIADLHNLFRMHDKFDPTREFLEFRIKFLTEEMEEILTALAAGEPGELVDGIIDLIVVALGTLDIFQVDTALAWNRVHVANMKKQRGENQKRVGSAGNDLIKPPGWTAPYHGDNVGLMSLAVFSVDQESCIHGVNVNMMCSQCIIQNIERNHEK